MKVKAASTSLSRNADELGVFARAGRFHGRAVEIRLLSQLAALRHGWTEMQEKP